MNLLNLVNTEAGRHLLGIKEKDPIVKITPEGWHFYHGQHDGRDWFTMRTHLLGHKIVPDTLMPIFTKMDIASVDKDYESFLHFSDLERKPNKYPSVYLTTDTFSYINVNGSGRLFYDDATFSTAHDAATAEQVFQNSYILDYNLSTSIYGITRHYNPFDTSSLPNGANISSAFLRWIGNGTAEVDGENDNLTIVVSTQASATNLVVADYDAVGTTSFGTFDVGSWNETNGATNDITLNSTGLAAISKTGNTLLCVRMGQDVSNTAPTGQSRVDFKSGTLLSVTYTTLPGAIIF